MRCHLIGVSLPLGQLESADSRGGQEPINYSADYVQQRQLQLRGRGRRGRGRLARQRNESSSFLSSISAPSSLARSSLSHSARERWLRQNTLESLSFPDPLSFVPLFFGENNEEGKQAAFLNFSQGLRTNSPIPRSFLADLWGGLLPCDKSMVLPNFLRPYVHNIRR